MSKKNNNPTHNRKVLNSDFSNKLLINHSNLYILNSSSFSNEFLTVFNLFNLKNKNNKNYFYFNRLLNNSNSNFLTQIPNSDPISYNFLFSLNLSDLIHRNNYFIEKKLSDDYNDSLYLERSVSSVGPIEFNLNSYIKKKEFYSKFRLFFEIMKKKCNSNLSLLDLIPKKYKLSTYNIDLFNKLNNFSYNDLKTSALILNNTPSIDENSNIALVSKKDKINNTSHNFFFNDFAFFKNINSKLQFNIPNSTSLVQNNKSVFSNAIRYFNFKNENTFSTFLGSLSDFNLKTIPFNQYKLDIYNDFYFTNDNSIKLINNSLITEHAIDNSDFDYSMDNKYISKEAFIPFNTTPITFLHGNDFINELFLFSKKNKKISIKNNSFSQYLLDNSVSSRIS